MVLEIVQYVTNLPATGEQGPTGVPGSTGVKIFPGPNVFTGDYGDGRDGNLHLKDEILTLERDMFYSSVVLENSTIETQGNRFFSLSLATTGGTTSYFLNYGHTGESNTGSGNIVGGLGGFQSTLGGGSAGGIGYSRFHDSTQNGVPLFNAGIWSANTTLGFGADAPFTSETEVYGQGLGGNIACLAARANYDILCALNPTFKPAVPMLAGGSGGGGGQGALTFPGSGGGGGGGVVVIASNVLSVPTSSPLIVDVKGGDAGRVFVGGPTQTTSGGGGGGGFVLLKSQSPSSNYMTGLTLRTRGGGYVDPDGNTQYANPGAFVDFFNPQNNVPLLTNPQPIFIGISTDIQTIANNTITTVAIPDAIQIYGFKYRRVDDAVVILQPGIYNLTFHAISPETVSGVWSSWLALNSTDNVNKIGFVSNTFETSLSVQLQLNTDDYVQVRVLQNSGAPLDLDGSTTPITFSISLLKPLDGQL